jgi:hypothetical protein
MIKIVVYYTSYRVQQMDATDDVCYCFASFMRLPRYIDIRYAAKAPRWRLVNESVLPLIVWNQRCPAVVWRSTFHKVPPFPPCHQRKFVSLNAICDVIRRYYMDPGRIPLWCRCPRSAPNMHPGPNNGLSLNTVGSPRLIGPSHC